MRAIAPADGDDTRLFDMMQLAARDRAISRRAALHFDISQSTMPFSRDMGHIHYSITLIFTLRRRYPRRACLRQRIRHTVCYRRRRGRPIYGFIAYTMADARSPMRALYAKRRAAAADGT